MTTYTLRISDDGYSTDETIEAATQEDAKQIASDKADEWLETGDWDTSGGTLWLCARWALRAMVERCDHPRMDGPRCTECDDVCDCEDGLPGEVDMSACLIHGAQDEQWEEVASGVANLTIQPDAPKCLDGKRDTHDWQSPYEVVGGIKENPGVWGHGGGVEITEVCVRCGCGRHTDTWAQNPSTGEQGLESVSYEAGEFADEIATLEDA